MRLTGKKIGILLESDFYDPEIWYYNFRFQEEGADLHFLTRLWGQKSLTFQGHEFQTPFECHESFEDIDDNMLQSFSALIVPSAMVADRLRYTEDVNSISPAAAFLKRAFAEKSIIKGIICHGLWLASPIAEVIQGRQLTCHNNLISDAKNYGAVYLDEDIVVDGDLVTGRTGGHCNLFARRIIDLLSQAP